MTFLDRLDTLMREKGLSKSRLAQVSGVPYTTIDGFYKKGYENTKLSTIRKLAAALDVCIDDLVVSECPAVEKLHTASDAGLSDRGRRIGQLYDAANERDKKLVDITLEPYEGKTVPTQKLSNSKKTAPKIKRRADGFGEIEVFDEQLPAAGYGSYFDAPKSHKEQYPLSILPDGATFGVLIGGNSMEPKYKNHATAFVQSAPRVEAGEIGLFSLNGEPYIKQLVVDDEQREIRLHSLNPDYKDKDIVIHEYDDLRTFGRVLGSYPE